MLKVVIQIMEAEAQI